MISLLPCNTFLQTTFLFNPSKLPNTTQTQACFIPQTKTPHRRTLVKCSAENQGERQVFLTMEEAGLVEISGLSTHERFLCRLTVTLFSYHLSNHSYVYCFFMQVKNDFLVVFLLCNA